MTINPELIILLVEDSGFQREYASAQLQEIGFDRVVEAQDGVEALKYIQKRKVDLVISDWEMPNMDGV
jgi:two-component system chemotaxis response regulator CheY